MAHEADYCTFCKWTEPISIHTIHRDRNGSVYLCTACILHAHPGRYCPICFDVYEQDVEPDNNSRVKCLHCPAVAHLACRSGGASGGYICPCCSDPSFVFFDLTWSNQGLLNFNEEMRKQIVCASKIATDHDGFCI